MSMTENEAKINGKSFSETISQIEEFMESDDVHGELFTVLRSARDFMENLNEEIQPYRAIGTIDEFKALKDDTIPIIHGKSELELHDKQIRAKAIDEFAERIALEISESIIWGMLPTDCKDGVSDEIVDYVIDTSKKIAEQMKAGVKNE